VNLTQGYRRVAPGQASMPLRVDMRGTACLVPAGTALRLSIAPACFPAFPVNDGDGTPPATSRRIDQRITTLTLRHGAGSPSRLLLPVNESA
jgi:predicted acyl esterase